MSAALDQANSTLDEILTKVNAINPAPAGVPESDVQGLADKAAAIKSALDAKFPA